MAKGQKHIIIDEYTYDLLQRAVNEGRGSNIDDAIRRSISKYLGIPYKSKRHIKIEQDLARVQELARLARKEE
ncbi:unnamed protein product [marine sediment metagenome]|uniref:Uncharacterized protein n=1 Tax=marine sediment metagenome TaxID=412755 RepID=X1LSA4_9ZZZZ